MSSPKRPVILSPDAQDDFADIQSYTLQTYGQGQWEKYEGRIADVFALLSEHPYTGSPRAGLPRDILVFPVEKHRIFYRVRPDAVYIGRILHSSRDIRHDF